MTTKVEEQDGKFVVTFNGELDTAAAAETEEALAPVMESLGKDIIFDCTDLEYIASSGLRLLLGVLKKAQAAGCHVVLKNVNDVVKDVLDLTGFVALFDIE
jgi:anti-anti-sigma factor